MWLFQSPEQTNTWLQQWIFKNYDLKVKIVVYRTYTFPVSEHVE